MFHNFLRLYIVLMLRSLPDTIVIAINPSIVLLRSDPFTEAAIYFLTATVKCTFENGMDIVPLLIIWHLSIKSVSPQYK